MGRVAVAHSPRGGMLLTKAAFSRNAGKEDLAFRRCSAFAAKRQSTVSGEPRASINQRPGMLIGINVWITPTSTMLP